jgi:hypothetical protein
MIMINDNECNFTSQGRFYIPICRDNNHYVIALQMFSTLVVNADSTSGSFLIECTTETRVYSHDHSTQRQGSKQANVTDLNYNLTETVTVLNSCLG